MLASLRNWLGDRDYRATILVIIGGLIGGIGAVALIHLQLQSGGASGTASVGAQVATIACGPIAALIAVLFILNTDRGDTLRLLLLAMLCGLQGPAILVGGANLILGLINQAPISLQYSEGNLVRLPQNVG